MQLPQLKRVRWAVRAALFLGVAASVAANVLHARPNIISQTISAWPPLALLLTVELTSRIPMHKRSLAFLRVVSTMAIAGIAAWVSYWHMQDVAQRYGETAVSAYLLPISVDGLIVVASVSLVELAGRIRMLEDLRTKLTAPAPAPAVEPVHFVEPTPMAVPSPPPAVPVFQPAETLEPVATPAANAAAIRSTTASRPILGDLERAIAAEALSAAPTSPAVAPRTPAPLTQSAPVSPAVAATTRPAPAYANGSTPPARPSVRAAVSAPARTIVTSPTTRPTESTTPRQRRPVQETAELADEIEKLNPDLNEEEVAKRLGISATRLKQVRREVREVRRAS